MSWMAVAKKDINDSIRARTLWAVIVIFFLAIGGLTYLAVDSGGADAVDVITGTTTALGMFLFIPIAGLLISVKSIVGERESGTVNLLLSMPHSRGDMLVGKFVGRSVVMGIATIVGFIPAILILFVEVEGGGIADILAIVLIAVLMAMMFVGIGVGFSALVNSETQATVGGIAVFFLLYLWPFIINQLFDLINESIPEFMSRFWLLTIFGDMVNAIVPEGDGLTADSTVYTGIEGEAAFYMQNWFAFVILALWIIVPLAIGYVRFNSIDL